MAIPNTYDLLITSIQQKLEDDSDEFTAYIPTAIGMGEQRVLRSLDLYRFRTNASSQVTTIGTSTVAKPSDCIFTFKVAIIDPDTGVRKNLIKKDEDFITEYSTGTGTPKYFADLTDTTLVLAPTPDKAYTLDINYAQRPTSLSSTNQTNRITEVAPDILFIAAMIDMLMFMKDYPTAQTFTSEYDKLVQDFNTQAYYIRLGDTEGLRKVGAV